MTKHKINKQITFFIFFVFIILIPSLVSGVSIKAVKVEKGPQIDGLLTDSVWDRVNPFSDFKVIEPNTGGDPSEKTELRVIYDDSNLYIGIFCYASEPSKISVGTLQHDNSGNGNDQIQILLDPFQDKRTAYIFFVNAKGARTDGLAAGESYTTNWDGIWEAQSKILSNGWSTEIRIPFKTISFNPKLTEWGLNVQRRIPYKQEIIRMSGISRDSFFFNPAEAAALKGIETIKQGKGLTFKPYATLQTNRDYKGNEKREWKLNGGFDLYKSFTPNLIGVVTYHTDFAETEADDRQINLTRFSLYFPEKRSFFLEGSEIFNFGIGLGSSFIPFFSRRIGLFEGKQSQIEYGAKIFGKIGNTSLALLDVKTDEVDGIPARNFVSGRIYQNIFAESKVGIIFTSGDPRTKDSNTLLGFDFTYTTSKFLKNKNFSAGAWWVQNWNNQKEGSHTGYGVKIDYPNDLFDLSLIYYSFGDALDPGLGFIPRNSIRHLGTGTVYRPRPQKGFMGSTFRQIFIHFDTSIYWDLNGNIESSKIMIAPFNFDMRSGESLEFYIMPQREILLEPFEVAENMIIPPGDYKFTSYSLELNSASYRPVYTQIEYDFGDFYNGKLKNLEIALNANVKGNIKLGLVGNFVHGTLPQGKFKEEVYQGKVDLYLTPDVGLMNYIQYDTVSKNIGANIRFKWEISPGNIIYLVYNKNWEKLIDSSSRFYPLMDRGVIKIQLSIRP